MAPASVYVMVSRSGEMDRPWSTVSSAVLTTAATCRGSTTWTTPRRKRAAPTPPESTATSIMPACRHPAVETHERVGRRRPREALQVLPAGGHELTPAGIVGDRSGEPGGEGIQILGRHELDAAATDFGDRPDGGRDDGQPDGLRLQDREPEALVERRIGEDRSVVQEPSLGAVVDRPEAAHTALDRRRAGRPRRPPPPSCRHRRPRPARAERRRAPLVRTPPRAAAGSCGAPSCRGRGRRASRADRGRSSPSRARRRGRVAPSVAPGGSPRRGRCRATSGRCRRSRCWRCGRRRRRGRCVAAPRRHGAPWPWRGPDWRGTTCRRPTRHADGGSAARRSSCRGSPGSCRASDPSAASRRATTVDGRGRRAAAAGAPVVAGACGS